MRMRRRSKAVEGWVRFPVDDPRYKNSGEGGMFVRLVVAPHRKDTPICCGGYSHVFYDESHIGDDDRPDPRGYSAPTMVLVKKEIANRERWDKVNFPGMFDEDAAWGKYLSVPYLAVVHMGSTGWSGWDERAGKYWRCRRSDLTREGLRIYDAMRSRWPNSRVTLQTWLDT